MPSRGDELGPLRFADDDDPDEIGGFTRGKRSYDEDEDEDGGWAINEDHSDRLWDSAEDVDDEDADEEGTRVTEDETEDDEEEADLFGAAPVRGRRGRPKGSGKKQEGPPSIFAGSENVFDEIGTEPVVTRASSSASTSARPVSSAAKPASTKPVVKAAKKAAAPKSRPAAKKTAPKAKAKKSAGKSSAKKAGGERKPAAKKSSPARKGGPARKTSKKPARRR